MPSKRKASSDSRAIAKRTKFINHPIREGIKLFKSILSDKEEDDDEIIINSLINENVEIEDEETVKQWKIQMDYLHGDKTKEKPGFYLLQAYLGGPGCGKTRTVSDKLERWFKYLKQHYGILAGGKYNNFYLFCTNFEKQVETGNWVWLLDRVDRDNTHIHLIQDPPTNEHMQHLLDTIDKDDSNKPTYIIIDDIGGSEISNPHAHQSSAITSVLVRTIRWKGAMLMIMAHQLVDIPISWRRIFQQFNVWKLSGEEMDTIRRTFWYKTQGSGLASWNHYYNEAFKEANFERRGIQGFPRMIIENKNAQDHTKKFSFYNRFDGTTNFEFS